MSKLSAARENALETVLIELRRIAAQMKDTAEHVSLIADRVEEHPYSIQVTALERITEAAKRLEDQTRCMGLVSLGTRIAQFAVADALEATGAKAP